MKLTLDMRYRTKSGDVWHVFREMGRLFAARRERDGLVEYFYPSGRASHPSHRGREIRLLHSAIVSQQEAEITSIDPTELNTEFQAVLLGPPESGTVTVGGEPPTSVHVTIERGAS